MQFIQLVSKTVNYVLLLRTDDGWRGTVFGYMYL